MKDASKPKMPITLPYEFVKELADFIRVMKVNPWIRAEYPQHYWWSSNLLRHLEHYLEARRWSDLRRNS